MRNRHSGRAGVINADGHAIGVDIGATAVRAVVLAPGQVEGRPVVSMAGSGSVELPRGAVVDGVVQDQAAVSSALKKLWRDNKLECRRVVLGIANPQILVRDMQMPQMSPEQQAKALPFRAREVVALPMDQVILDFAALSTPENDTDLIDGLLVATPHQPVLAAVAAVEKAGLTVARVDLSSFGTLRSIADENLRVEAVVDLGADLTTIVIHDQGVPKLVRSVALGGQHLTDFLVDRLRASQQDAQDAKHEHGLEGDDAAVIRAVGDGIRPLVTEIRSSINYYSANDGAPIERLSLTGGGAALRGLPALLSSQLGVPVEVIDPMRRVRPTEAQHRLADRVVVPSAVAVGLAMGAAA
jgi:type IV pilus assembly protein PilM